MTVNAETVASQEAAKQPSDKELNFRKLEESFNKKMQQKESEIASLHKKIDEISKVTINSGLKGSYETEDDYDDDDPYIDRRKLEKRLGKVVKQVGDDTDNRIQSAVQKALSEERRSQWLKNNSDFFHVMDHAQALADKDPELAESILEMPDTFERQKLVYKNIKALGLHKKEEPKSSIQDTIDKNRRSPYYQPSGVASPGYGTVNIGRDVSPQEGQNAYKKMQELKSRLRI